MNRSRGRLGLENEPTAFAAAHRRVRARSVATVSAVATVKIDRGRQCNNTSSDCHREIRSQTRAVNGIAALVTTPLRLVVTRAPSGQATLAPGIRLSQGLLLFVWCRDIRAFIPAHWGPQAPLNAAPSLARELEARVAVTGKACGLSGQLWIIGSIKLLVLITNQQYPAIEAFRTNKRDV